MRIALREHGELWSGMDALARMLGEGGRSAPATSVCQTLLARLTAQREEVVGRAIVQQYSHAWKNLETALDQNNTDVLNESFIGYAQDKLNAQIAAQKKNGLSTRYIDHGHQVDAILYSRDGSAVELRDTAQLEIQYLDGGKVIASENTSRHYIAVITLVDDRWKVRALDSTPGF